MTQLATNSQDQDLGTDFAGFHNLFHYHVQEVLLVCSLYESYILEEDGLIGDLLLSEYQELNLSHAPRVSRASNCDEALELIREHEYDLVITMARLGEWNVHRFAEEVKAIKPNLTLVVLADEPRELPRIETIREEGLVDEIFFWHGDAKILLTIIKCIEDRMNVAHDTKVGNVRVIILIENSIRFYSAYLPLLYTEVMRQTQALMEEGVNRVQRLLRMRARPRILLAQSFEEAWRLYTEYEEKVLGIISDVRFPRQGQLTDDAGIEFTKRVKRDSPHMPVLLQSSDDAHAQAAAALHACFLHKRSRTLLQELRAFVLSNFGFGDFVFKLPNGMEIGRARDLTELTQKLWEIPDESLLYHATSNHFSNWLMARTEFQLAASIRPRQVSDFKDAAGLRSYLINTLTEFQELRQAGVVADFSPRKFSRATAFARLGGGSMGGKARGLAFMNALLSRHDIRHRFPDVRVAVPNTAAIGADLFDAFLDENNLRDLITQDTEDEELDRAFLASRLPADIQRNLATFLDLVTCPLAVRSSSLLEDSHGQPFAGVYRTYMIPNNHEDPAVRLRQLCEAIKLVYASTFTRAAKLYLEATGHHVGEEKMGVILQEVVGSQYGNRFYPTFSGVARSYNFYPTGKLLPEDGVASVALGLGKMVVEGREMLMFSPNHPGILPQFNTTEDLFANAQRHFYALDMEHKDVHPDTEPDATLIQFDLDAAEADGTLQPIGSVYSSENDVVYDGIARPGPRLVTFAHVLKSGIFPLAEILRVLLDLGRHGMACPCEIEFAVNMNTKPMEFGVLQIRPTIPDEQIESVAWEETDQNRLLCYSPQALGNGTIGGLKDIVFVRPENFDSAKTREIAAEIGQINNAIRNEHRSYVLIGPGRWGSADPWLGIPVTWEQISSAQVIIETTLSDFVITPSQGTHFFQNITSFHVGYLTLHPSIGEGFLDWDWLKERSTVKKTHFLHHVRLEHPLDVKLNGRERRGAIFKPNGGEA